MEFSKQGMINNTLWLDGANHWSGDSRLQLGASASLSTFAGHIYKCGNDGTSIQEAYVNQVEEVVRACNGIFPSPIGNGAQYSEGMTPDNKTGFVWIDLHGVPPLPQDTTNGNDKSSTMDGLWEALQLNQGHRMKLRDEIKEEYQRRVVMLQKNGLSNANAFFHAMSGTHPNNEGDKVNHTLEKGELTLSQDFECFCPGYSFEDGLEVLDDPDAVNIFNKSNSINCKGGNKEEYYVALRVVTLLEHTVHHIAKIEKQMHVPYLMTGENKQDVFFALSHVSDIRQNNPFLRSVNPFCDPTPLTNFNDLHNRSDSDCSKNDSQDHLLLETDRYSGALCIGGDKHTRPLQSAITYVFCFEGLCVTWCPRSISASWKDRGCVWQGKNWSQLREAVLSHCIYPKPHLPPPDGSKPDAFHIPERRNRDEEMMTTSLFVSLLLSTVCYTYLPNINAMLNEVEAIDSMLPLILPKMESDQSDAHRRILMLRHRLSNHRRELISKKKLLKSLKGPSVSVLAAFMAQTSSSDHDQRGSLGVSKAMYPSPVSETFTVLDAVSDIIDQTLHKMDTSRIVLGNATILYNSNVISSNYEVSNDSDYFMVLVHYVFVTIMPAHIIVAQWGINFLVPFHYLDSLTPFFVIVGTLVLICIIAPIFPFWAYYTGRIHLII
ncbi:unnamed protein product [Phytomonas sp. Hart1]|nr:unnamed protein product [Phytomonas sp. Hart1]|eukprot:CCW69860.1 unnamed protein product [Phytomonas sp. isolate Hart1]